MEMNARRTSGMQIRGPLTLYCGFQLTSFARVIIYLLGHPNKINPKKGLTARVQPPDDGALNDDGVNKYNCFSVTQNTLNCGTFRVSD